MLLASFRVDCDQARERSGDVHHSVDHERSSVKDAAGGQVFAIAEVADMKGPIHLELGYFGPGDLFRRRVLGSARVAGGGGSLLRGRKGESQGGQDREPHAVSPSFFLRAFRYASMVAVWPITNRETKRNTGL